MTIKDWMNCSGFTYRELAPRMGLTAGTLCQKVNGTVDWKPRDLAFLHREFGLSADFVLGFEGESNEKPLQLV